MSGSMDLPICVAATAACPNKAHQDKRVWAGRRQVILHHLRQERYVSNRCASPRRLL